MTTRTPRLRTTVLALAVAFSFQTANSQAANSQAAAKWTVPRTPDGHPDLQGVWTNATITPLERPDKFGNRLKLTAQEAREIESAEANYNADADAPSDLSKPAAETCRSGSGANCGYNNFWIDRGSQVVTINGEQRSSLIVDPENGKIPFLPGRNAAAARGQTAGGNSTGGTLRLGSFDGPESRPLAERCLLAFGSSSGPPMLPVLYNNHYQIVQGKDTVTILVEMVHDARIVRLGGEHVPQSIRKWMGDSIGHFEGDTLVVETTNFQRQQNFRGASQNLKVVERFTRISPDTMVYRFEVDDSTAFSRPWTAEMAMHSTNDRIYEYACHEGNYALPGILAGAREEEKVTTLGTRK